jgi:penicillin-binding protein 1C
MPEDKDDTLLSSIDEGETVDEVHKRSAEDHPSGDEGVDIRLDDLHSKDALSASKPASPPKREDITTARDRWVSGCRDLLIRVVILGLVLIIAALVGIVSFGLYQYYSLAATLPSVDDLKAHAAHFETTRIMDREGNLLYEILDPQAGRRTFVPLDEISPYMVAAIISTEDSQFYSHPGYDLLAIARAFVQNLQQGEIVSGASTITQQIARNLLFSPEERYRITARRKTREVMVAAEITRRYTKDEILELYLNQVYFGNLAYGVEAAAETYFNTTSARLTLSQASFLAGLIQAPSVYDVYTNREATLTRQQQVLAMMIDTSSEQGCIYVSNSQHPICVSPEEAGAAAAELVSYQFSPPVVQIQFPHWVIFIRSELERLYDPQTIYRSGFTVYTTIDPYLQQQAQEILVEQISELAEHRVSSGALVAIQPSSGEILAMVGSADFYNEDIDGQVNMAIRPRQPGSAIKPLTYTAAFEKGWTPSSLIWDVPSEFPPSGDINDPRPPYKPINYDERFHGPVTVRSALANSYNVPAVKTLDFVGIFDDPDTTQEEGLVALARRLGITTLTRNDYGLSLTLGGGEVTPLELTSAYATLANGGLRVPSVGILRIIDHSGDTVYEYQPPIGEQVIRPEHAYLISSILSDNPARTPAFGPNSVLNLPFLAAAKTGTTNDFRDNWTLGYTPDVAVGVWVGNADNTPMQDTTGLSGAAPIWNRFMQIAYQHITDGQYTPFSTPIGIIDMVICAISGTQPSQWCPSHRSERFAADQPPLPKEQDLWREVTIDSYSLELASAECPDFTAEKLGLNINDPWGRKWVTDGAAGRKWAKEMGFEDDDLFFIPEKSCSSNSPRPILALTDPSQGAIINMSPLPIFGKASATANFKYWELHYGIGIDPVVWTRITRSGTPHDQPDELAVWDLSDLANEPITLRLTVHGNNNGKAETFLHLMINLPTPTPTPTQTSTIILTPTSTSTLLPSETHTVTPSPTSSITSSPTTSSTPTSTDTYTPTSLPSATTTNTPSPTPTPTPTGT